MEYGQTSLLREFLKLPDALASKHEVLFYLWIQFFANSNTPSFNYREFKKPKTAEEITAEGIEDFTK